MDKQIVGAPAIGFLPYDEALKKFFTQKLYPDQSRPNEFITLVPTFNPTIEFADQESLSLNNEQVDGRKKNTLRLPMLALSQLDFSMDLSRWTRANFRKLAWSEEGMQIIQSEPLVPMDIMYGVSTLSKYRSSSNQMIRNILLKFNTREVAIDVDLGGHFRTQRVLLTYDYRGPTNVSDNETVGKERLLRYDFTFNFHCWVLPDPTMRPTVKKYLLDLYLGNGGTPFPGSHDLPPFPGWILEKEVDFTPEILSSTP